jgi:uncharacterized protein (DUF1800 family)
MTLSRSQKLALPGSALAALLLVAAPAPGQDVDVDGVPDALDNCVVAPNGPAEDGQADRDGDGIGDACECGDANGDGLVDRRDRKPMKRCAKGTAACSPLCDVTGDGICSRYDRKVVKRYARAARRRAKGRRPRRHALTKQDLVCAARPRPDCDADPTQPACPAYGAVVEHVLARVGYGGDAWTRRRVFERGLRGYLLEQLDPGSVDDPEFEAAREPYVSGPYATWGRSIPVLESQFCREGGAGCTDRIDEIGRVVANLSEVKLLRSVYSRRQLEAVLLDFWLNHFNVDGGRRIARWAEPEYEQVALRPHVLGRFEDLLLAMARGTAMLDYLDLRRSRAGGSNENFARELLELHSIGKTGTFDEQDVQEVTRVLTGYTWDAERAFVYVPGRHDAGMKRVTFEATEPWVFDGSLGCAGRPPEAFEDEGHVLLCLLAHHPKTARRIARKLIQRFVTEDPEQALVDRVARVWLETGGDLHAVMRAVLLDDEFLSTRHVRAKLKRPSLFAASLVRAVGPGSEGRSQLVDQPYSGGRELASFNGIMADLRSMGEALYRAPPPTGYPETSPAWAGAGTLLLRLNLVERIVAGIPDPLHHWEIDPDAGAAEIVLRLEARLAPGALLPETRQRIVGLLLERQAARLILSSPELLLH